MYLDPSFGGMLLQIVVAIIAGGGAIAFGMRRKIKALFKKKDSSQPMPKTDVELSENVIDMMDEKNKK